MAGICPVECYYWDEMQTTYLPEDEAILIEGYLVVVVEVPEVGRSRTSHWGELGGRRSQLLCTA